MLDFDYKVFEQMFEGRNSKLPPPPRKPSDANRIAWGQMTREPTPRRKQ